MKHLYKQIIKISLVALLCLVPFASVLADTLQDPFANTTYIGSQTGSEVEGGNLINTNQTGEAYLDFSGSSQYVDLGDQTDFSFGNGSTDSAFSASAWVNMDDATNFYVFNKDDYSTSSNREWNLNIGATDLLRLSLIDQSTGGSIARIYNTALTSYQGRWIHVAFTYSGSSASSGIKLYLNGKRVDDTDGNAGSYTAMENKASTLKIGGRTESSNYANGKIRDARLFNSELTADNISSLYQTGTNPSTPLGWWKLDEGTGTTAADSGSGAHDGDLTGHAPTWVSAPSEYASRSQTTSTDLMSGLGSTAVSNFKYTTAKKPGGTEARLQFSSDNSTWKNANGDLVSNGGGYQFDGVDDVITVAQTVDTLMSNALGTMSVWVRPDGAGVSDANGYLTDGIIADSSAFVGIHWGTRTGGGTGFHFYNWDGTPGDYVDYAVPTTDYGKWFHLAWKHSGGTLYAYVNGVLVGSVASGNTVTVTGTMRIGANYTTGADFFPGAIDDVRIYDIGLTDTEIWDLYSRGKESYNSSTGQELWLKLNGDATDSSGNGFDGSVSGATSITAFYELPAFGEITTDELDTLSFDGVDDKITVPAGEISAGVNGASQITFGGWVNSDLFPSASAKTILRAEIATSAAAGLYLSYTSSTITYGGRSQSADAFQSTTYAYTRSRVWDHVIVVMDIANDTLKLYLNGALVKTTTGLSFGASTYTDANSQSVVDTIGAGGTAGSQDYWNGDMANIAIWDDERTAAEILADFQNGYTDSGDANLVSYWVLNEGTGTTADNAQGTAGLDGTISGATWTKDSARPIPAVGTQKTIDISGLGYTTAFYVREYLHTYQLTPDRAYALTEVSVDYTATVVISNEGNFFLLFW